MRVHGSPIIIIMDPCMHMFHKICGCSSKLMWCMLIIIDTGLRILIQNININPGQTRFSGISVGCDLHAPYSPIDQAVL